MTKTPKHEPLFRGPVPAAAMAAVAGVSGGLMRQWAKHGFIDARQMWPRRYEDQRRRVARSRKVAVKLKADLEAAGSDASVVDEMLKRLDHTTPKDFVDVEFLQVCALAELTRHGFSRGQVRNPKDRNRDYLLDALTRQLAVRAFLVPAPGDSEPLGPDEREGERTRFLVAEVRNEGPSLSIQELTPTELSRYFAEPDRAASATWTVIDCDALLNRILAKLNAVREAKP